MTSTATNTGSASISVYFKQGVDPDMAAVNVQNRVAKAQGFLPAEVTQVGVIAEKRQTSMLMGFALYSDDDRYDQKFLENYANINIVPEVKRVPGVGEAMVMGTDYSMRIWLKPDVMAEYKLMPSDVSAALAEQNIEAAPGQFGEQGNQSFQYVMRYKGRLQTEEEFENIVIRATENGEVLRLKDIANIELGRLTYGFSNEVNGHPGVTVMVFQTAGSNATSIIQNIEKYLKEIEPTLPPGMKTEVIMSANDFLFASIHEVVKTLLEAFLLVVIVVYVFLQDFRSTLIPLIAIPVALIGTFFVLYVIGFSLNLLTLCAMVLAIAIVVDDAIVVVEGVHAKLDQGCQSARKASIDAMSELGGAIVSITLVMMAVFIPVSFMTGTSGTFYRQFGLTLAIAIGLSAINALTLSPALCALFLKPHDPNKEEKKTLSIFNLLIIIVLSILIICFLIFTAYNTLNSNIISGVHIKGLDVSNMSMSDAKYQLDNYLNNLLPEEIKVKHGDFETTISLSQIGATFDTKSAINSAYNVGRQGNIFQNNMYVLSTMFGNVNIEPILKIDKEQLTKNLEDISTQLPDKVTESSYYIENSNLIITSGKEGNVIDTDATIEVIKNVISNLSNIEEPIEMVVKSEKPNSIDIEKIHNEIYKEPVDAYYTQDPFTVYPSENGVDFNVSIEEAKAILGDQTAEEYTIPLNILYPKVTTNMIGTEAFPDLLSTYSTNYAASNKNRTTNLILAANKINGTVLMPGETFSYNKVVGARTIAAGYKEAPIYVSGEVVDGVGGGICQITTTLYNAVVYANLEIVQRTNHQFVPSYAPASRDATVVYGSIDFQFKNNRNYPIKIVCSVSGGVANFQIFGLKQENDYDVEISAYVTGRTQTAIYSEAYKILKQDGKVVSSELLSKDTYKRH